MLAARSAGRAERLTGEPGSPLPRDTKLPERAILNDRELACCSLPRASLGGSLPHACMHVADVAEAQTATEPKVRRCKRVCGVCFKRVTVWK